MYNINLLNHSILQIVELCKCHGFSFAETDEMPEMLKNPDWTPIEVRRWVMIDNAAVKDVQINRKTLNSFITYQIVKFRQGLDVLVHRRGNGRPSISIEEAMAGPQYL